MSWAFRAVVRRGNGAGLAVAGWAWAVDPASTRMTAARSHLTRAGRPGACATKSILRRSATRCCTAVRSRCDRRLHFAAEIRSHVVARSHALIILVQECVPHHKYSVDPSKLSVDRAEQGQ